MHPWMRQWRTCWFLLPATILRLVIVVHLSMLFPPSTGLAVFVIGWVTACLDGLYGGPLRVAARILEPPLPEVRWLR